MSPVSITEASASGRPWVWPTIIVSALALHAAALLVVVFIATRDPSFAVEPNHYQKSLGWDGSAARLRASRQLGWTVSLQTDPHADELGRRRLSCRIVDKNGVAVVGADVQLLFFHHARAADRVQVSMNPEPDGTYAALVPMKRAGLWECRIAVRRGATLFNTTVMHEVGGTGSSGE
jgi:nitrogen fixation protein FixH